MTIIENYSKTPEASTVQKALNLFGATLKVDGEYGSMSETAMRAFESKYRLTVDGKVNFTDLIKMLDMVIGLVATKDTMISALKSSAEVNVATNATLIKDNSVLQGRISELSVQLASERKNVEDAIAEVNRLTVQEASVMKSLEELSASFYELEKSNQFLAAENISLGEEIDSLELQLEAMNQPTISWEDATLGQLLKQIGKIIFNLKA